MALYQRRDVGNRPIHHPPEELASDLLRIIIDETGDAQPQLGAILNPGRKLLSGTPGADDQHLARGGKRRGESAGDDAVGKKTHQGECSPAAQKEEYDVAAAVVDHILILDQKDREHLEDAHPEHPLGKTGHLMGGG